jgi:hypothetical protein
LAVGGPGLKQIFRPPPTTKKVKVLRSKKIRKNIFTLEKFTMQTEFKLTPLKEKAKTYTWEKDAVDPEPKYAVLFHGKILAIFSGLYWAEYFAEHANITLEVMKVEE